MKKKIIAILTVIVLLTIFLASCGIFVKNEERVNNQVVYTLHHKGQTEYITYKEYKKYFNQLWYRFYLTYNKDFDKTIEKISEILIKRKLYLMEAKAELAGGGDVNKLKTVDFLGNDEKDYVIKEVNNIFEKKYQEKINALISAMSLKDESNQTIEFLPNIPAREKIKVDEEIQFVKNESLLDEDVEKTWIEKYSKNKHVITIPTEYENHAKIDEIRTAYEDAYNQVISEYEEQGTSYEYYLEQYYENALIKKYKEALKSDIEVKDEEINNKYQKMIKDNQNNYAMLDQKKKDAEIQTLLSLSEKSYIFPAIVKDDTAMQAIGVKSLLLSFNDDQKKALEKMKAAYGVDSDKYKQERIKLAIDTCEMEIDGIKVKAGIKVYKSNLEYDKDKSISINNVPFVGEKEENKFNYTQYTYEQILEQIKEDFDSIEALVAQKYPNAVAEGKKDYYINYEKEQIFIKWLNLVNDDPGMMKSPNEKYVMKVSETVKDEKYVPEFSALGNAIYKENKGKVGVYSASNVDGSFEYLNTSIGTKSGISFVVNDFGIHIILVIATLPNIQDEKVKAYNKDNELINKSDVKNIAYYVANGDYILHQFGYTDYKQYIKENLVSGKLNLLEQEKQKELYKLDNKETGHKVNKKVLNSIVNPIKKEAEKIS